jgi:hypothetical protein
MATINGMTAEKMQEILDGTIASAEISGTDLVFVRVGGSSFSAGNFQDYIDDQVDSKVASAVAGGLTAKGGISGSVSFSGLTPADMVNRIFTATLTGNITIDAANLPSPALPGTQFAMRLTQDGTGNRTLTLVGIKRSQGVLALSTPANSVDIIMFMYDGTSWYAGAMGVAFS